jgi:uncharacterized protein YecE (DUF72 family)
MAGWDYPDWRRTFHPAGLPQKKELAWASTQVTSIELNGSFPSLQKPARWMAATIRPRHDGSGDVCVYFDNDTTARAPLDARNLIERLDTPVGAPSDH